MYCYYIFAVMSGKHRKQSSQSLIEIRLNEAIVNKSYAEVREIIEQGGLGLLAAKVILVNIFNCTGKKRHLSIFTEIQKQIH